VLSVKQIISVLAPVVYPSIPCFVNEITIRHLTYMSIVTILRDKLANGMLHLLTPKVPGDSHRRVLVIGSRLWEEIESKPRDSTWEVRIGQLKADLENFVISEQIRPSYLFRLYPRSKAVWESDERGEIFMAPTRLSRVAAAQYYRGSTRTAAL